MIGKSGCMRNAPTTTATTRYGLPATPDFFLSGSDSSARADAAGCLRRKDYGLGQRPFHHDLLSIVRRIVECAQ